MSTKTFYDHHGFDEADAMDMEYEMDGGPRVAHCNRCGSQDVRWRQQSGKWVLFSDKPGVVHTCPINASGFDPVAEE